MTDVAQVKEEITALYDDMSQIHDTEEWLLIGGEPRPPECLSSKYFVDRKVACAVKLCGVKKNMRVLEIGANVGNMTFPLAEVYGEVVAADLSHEGLDKLARRAKHYGVENISTTQIDAESVSELGENSFDAVFSFSALRYCPRLDVAIDEIAKILKPGGKFVSDFPNPWCPWFGPLKKLMGRKLHIYDHLHSRKNLLGMMSEAGLVNLEYRHILFPPRQLPTPVFYSLKLAGEILEHIPLLKNTAGILFVKGEKT